MQWQHYNSLKSTLWYIENLLSEIELSIDGKQKSIYRPVKLDLTAKQAGIIRDNIKRIYILLEEAKRDFNLEVQPIPASRIIDSNTVFIWKAIEDSWSHKMEKTSGRIASVEKKQKMDELLKKIMEATNQIRKIAEHETL